MTGPFQKEADVMVALAAEIELDGDLVDATRELREIAIVCDQVAVRFEAAASRVKVLLEDRLGR